MEFAQNPTFVAAEKKLLELHQFIREGNGDTEAADEVRESLYDLMTELSDAECKFLNNLSGDLFQLMDDEVYEPVADPLDRTEERIKPLLDTALKTEDTGQILSLLRKGPEYLSSHEIAFLRAIQFRSLQHWEVALEFAKYAAKCSPTIGEYRELRFLLTTTLGLYEDAITMCLDELDLANPMPRLFFVAGKVCQAEAHRLQANRNKDLSGTTAARLFDYLETEKAHALAQRLEEDLQIMSQAEQALAYLLTGKALVELENYEGAELAYRVVQNSEFEAMRDIADATLALLQSDDGISQIPTMPQLPLYEIANFATAANKAPHSVAA